jgi:phenylacetate-CoA ligase
MSGVIDDISEAQVLNSFQNAARRVPAYRDLLAKHGLRPDVVDSLVAFTRSVPVLDKQALFAAYALPQLCLDGTLGNPSLIYTSSGFSGVYSFGVENVGDEKKTARRIDGALDFFFSISKFKTLLINALPAGVRVPSAGTTLFDTGPRADAVLAGITKVGCCFDQIIIVAEHPLIKKIAEEGAASGIQWDDYKIIFISGGEIIPESFRRYISDLTAPQHKLDGGSQLVISLGISEIGLSMGQETEVCRKLRQLAHQNEAFGLDLFGDLPYLPSLVQWSSADYYLETPVGERGLAELVVTTLDPDRQIPLIRYKSGDLARIIDPREINAALKRHALNGSVLEAAPPILAFWGRGRAIRIQAQDIYPEQIKELIYRDADIAGSLTGCFRLSAHAGQLIVEFQLKRFAQGSSALKQRLERLIAEVVLVETDVRLMEFQRLDQALELNYQKKFSFFSESSDRPF